MSKNLAVIFPGVGYHCDKPLLYYSKKIANKKGYDIIEIQYAFTDVLGSIKTDHSKTEMAIENAFIQTLEQLSDVRFDDYERVVFIGKSIGTAIAARIAASIEVEADMIIFTPIEVTFAFLSPCEGLVFHGSADPLCDTDMCIQLCDEMSLTYAVIPEANHSLETGDVKLDIQNLEKIMDTVEKIL